MRYERFFKWLTLDMIIFVAANIFLIWHFQGRFSSLADIGYFKLLVLGLAAYRAANLLSNETITKPLRAPFVDETQRDGKIIEETKIDGIVVCKNCNKLFVFN